MIDLTNFFTFQVHGAANGHSQGGIVDSVAEVLTFIEGLIGLSPAEIFSELLPGIASITNIHPLIVHFPIAFLLAFFIIDLFGSVLNKAHWRQFSTGLLYLGTLSAGAAVAAGMAAEGSVEHGGNVHLIMQKHELIGISVLCLAVFLSLWRLLSNTITTGFLNILYLSCATLLVILMLVGADLGSLMVYKYGVAVEAVDDSMIDYFHEHTHSHSHD
jgi:uncharacterized membrane protein